MAANGINTQELDVVQEPNREESVGLLFREERERRRLTIKDVSKELHIRQMYLSCIEEGRLSELPGYVYIVGFIKSYAKFLELNEEELLRQLQLVAKDTVVYPDFMTSVPTHEQQMPSKKVLFGSLTLFFVFALLAYIYNNKSEEVLSSTVELPVRELDGNVTRVAPENAPQGQLLQEDTPVNFSSVTPIPEMVAPTRETKPAIASAVSSEIVIIAVKDSWVQVLNSKGVSIYVRLMHAGERYTLPAAAVSGTGSEKEVSPYVLNTGNGGGIKISLNGQESKLLGENGKIMRGITLTPEKIREFMGE